MPLLDPHSTPCMWTGKVPGYFTRYARWFWMQFITKVIAEINGLSTPLRKCKIQQTEAQERFLITFSLLNFVGLLPRPNSCVQYAKKNFHRHTNRTPPTTVRSQRALLMQSVPWLDSVWPSILFAFLPFPSSLWRSTSEHFDHPVWLSLQGTRVHDLLKRQLYAMCFQKPSN